MLPRICNHLSHFGLGNLVREYAAHSLTLGMDLQHNPGCFGAIHRKEALQDIHDELHRGIIVVDQHNLIERRSLELGRRFVDDQARPAFPPAFRIAHDYLVYRARFRALQAPLSKTPDWSPLSAISITLL